MLIENAEIEGESGFSVRIHGDRIAEIAPGLIAQRGEERLDALGAALLPGLHDHHLHLFALAASRTSLECGPPSVRDADGLAAALRAACSERLASGGDPGWIRGIGYHESVAGELDRQQLDRWTGSLPVRIQHRSGALWVVNSAGAERLQLHLRPRHPGIEVDRGGRATGRLFRADPWLRDRLGADPPPALGETSRTLASFGVTGFTDATPRNGAPEFESLQRARETGELLQSVLLMGSADLPAMQVPGLGTGALKLMLTETALPDFETLRRQVKQVHRRQRPVAMHCVTRAELLFALEIFSAAGVVPGDRIEHAAVAAPDGVDRLSDLGLCVVTQPNFIGERGDVYATDVEACDRRWLYRGEGFLAAGVALGGGTDAPFGDPDPWRAISTAVDRRSRSGRVMGAAEALTPERALGLFTSSATAPGGPPRRLASGGPADLCLLDRPWARAREELSSKTVRRTICSGRVAFARD